MNYEHEDKLKHEMVSCDLEPVKGEIESWYGWKSYNLKYLVC